MQNIEERFSFCKFVAKNKFAEPEPGNSDKDRRNKINYIYYIIHQNIVWKEQTVKNNPAGIRYCKYSCRKENMGKKAGFILRTIVIKNRSP